MNDGGSAFPIPALAEGEGMSLRDWFAGEALSGLLTDMMFPEDVASERMARVAKLAYRMADAMLKAREK